MKKIEWLCWRLKIEAKIALIRLRRLHAKRKIAYLNRKIARKNKIIARYNEIDMNYQHKGRLK